jgi:uncharacterized membrane protein YedE/YeeE
MNGFTPLPALAGGALIGLAATLFLLTHGRVAGISGIFGTLLRRASDDRTTALSFVAGLVVAGILVRLIHPGAFATSWTAALPTLFAAGLIVGFGTQLGSGCTSGHGVCGISRLSTRSIVATMVFMATGIATVFVVRHVSGGGP